MLYKLQIGLAVSLENKGKICHSNEHIQVQLNYFEGREEKGKPQQSSNANRSRENKDIRLTIVNTYSKAQVWIKFQICFIFPILMHTLIDKEEFPIEYTKLKNCVPNFLHAEAKR